MTTREQAAIAVRRALRERSLHEYDLTREEWWLLVTRTEDEAIPHVKGPTREQRRRLKQQGASDVSE